ncbi:MAG: hypothetical protein Q8P97_01680, partial [bacterium]|nr:hypothetical protein [bacterium]
MATKKDEEKDWDEDRGKRTKKDKDETSWFALHPDTKKTIAALLAVGLAIILLLSSFNKAGPAGSFLYKIFGELFGWGYYLLPLTLFIVAGVLLMTERQKVMGVTVVGAFALILSGLGLIDIISPKSGGFVGSLVGTIQVPFGYTASLVLTSTFLIAAVVTTLNTPIKLKGLFAKGDATTVKNPTSTELTAQEEKNIKEVEKNAQKESATKDEAEASKHDSDKKGDDVGVYPSIASENLKKRTPAIQRSFKNYVAPPLSLLKSSIEKP